MNLHRGFNANTKFAPMEKIQNILYKYIYIPKTTI